jgi:hypothetical protein
VVSTVLPLLVSNPNIGFLYSLNDMITLRPDDVADDDNSGEGGDDNNEEDES